MSFLRNYHTLVILKGLTCLRSDNNDANLYFEMTFSVPSPTSLLKFPIDQGGAGAFVNKAP